MLNSVSPYCLSHPPEAVFVSHVVSGKSGRPPCDHIHVGAMSSVLARSRARHDQSRRSEAGRPQSHSAMYGPSRLVCRTAATGLKEGLLVGADVPGTGSPSHHDVRLGATVAFLAAILARVGLDGWAGVVLSGSPVEA